MKIITDRHQHMRNFKLQFITNGTDVANTVAGAALALKGGCKWVQLRMKQATTEETTEAGMAISHLARLQGATFIIDDHVDLVDAVGADGVHLGKNDMPVDEARRLLGPDKIIGATANTFADILSAMERGADYIGLGPFRFTTTKSTLSPVLGLDGYRSILTECRRKGVSLPVVAIGGITLDDIHGILDTGADGIAVSGAILNAPDPAQATATWMKTISLSN